MFVICYNYKQSLIPPVMCIGSICFTLTVQVLLLLDHSSLKCIYTIILKGTNGAEREKFHAFLNLSEWSALYSSIFTLRQRASDAHS